MAHLSAPGPSTRSTSPMNYHVFLSFRGIDTRKNFTDHLYSTLLRKGIVTFRDDEDLERGDVISNKLLLSIEQSLFAIVVLSKNYASSPWCLDELQKIVESKQDRTVFPIFYGVDPSDIRHQNENVAQAFQKHERRFPDDKVRGWREALTKVANLSGWDTRDKHEAEIVEDISKFIWNKLCDELPYNFEHLVGDIQSKVNTIVSLLHIGLDDKCFIGIWGMGGIGKTTLARAVYDAIRKKFDASCFLANVREDSEKSSLVYLQKKLLSGLGIGEAKTNDSFAGGEVIRNFLCHRKVLIVLDDVSHTSQLDNLARNKEWFGVGSKIIITTRDIQLLTQYEQFEAYGVGTLHPDESLKLLCRKAFKKDKPIEGYLDLSKEVVECSGGLPLALEVLGSFLSRRKQSEWRDTLDKLKKSLHKNIFSQLHISYDGLEDEEYKTIFLDIACFFNGKRKFDVKNMLKICGLHSTIGINVLIEKSLLSFPQSNSNSRQNAEEDQDIHDMVQKMRRDTFLPTFMYHKLLEEASKEYLYMHGLLQEMGRNIVLQESPSDVGRRSRLWSLEDVDLVLKGNKGTKEVQSIILDLHHRFEAKWHPDCFSRTQNLRLLDLSRVHLYNNLNSLPSALKFLRWDCYTLKSLPPIDQLYELESLQLCNSKIRKLWDGTPSLHKLRIIDLSNSDYLMKTPDFSGTPNLEKLLLNYCDNLVQVHESVGQLKKLVELSLQYCINLVTLPTYLDMDNLEVFILGNCSKLEKLPEFGKSMRRLYFLDVRGTKITKIPLSIMHLMNLKYLDLNSWCLLKSIPELPPNLFIRASNYPFLESTSDLQYLIASCVSKGPIHLFSDSKRLNLDGGKGIQRWFKQPEHCHVKGDLGEVVTITADLPCDVADYEGERSVIAVCVVFECLAEAWRGFSINWKFQDYSHPNESRGTEKTPATANAYPIDMENCGQQPHPSGDGSQVDSKLYFPTSTTIPSGKTIDATPLPEVESRVYMGFYPIGKENRRRHPSGVGSQINLTLCFPKISTIDYVTIGGKKRHFRNLEVADCGWRLVCNKDLDASSSDFEEVGCCLNSGQLYELESLQLSSSKLKNLWNGAPFLDKLMTLDLSCCQYIIETPDFSGTPNLEKLSLRGCQKLVRVHESVGQLKKLVNLSLEDCQTLVTLPSYFEMDNLEEFILCGCESLEKLPEFGKTMRNLYFFDLRGTSIIEIPASIIHLINLKSLHLEFWYKLKSIPELPPNLIISASGCPWLEPKSALSHLFALHHNSPNKGPIHVVFDKWFFGSILKRGLSRWIKQRQHRHSKSSSSEVITITVDIPCDVADYEGDCWAIAVCIGFQCQYIESRDFCINWKFQDYCHPNNNKRKRISDGVIDNPEGYVGYYPIDKQDYQPHPSGTGSRVDLTLSLAVANISNETPHQNLEIVLCRWDLIHKKDFDAS